MTCNTASLWNTRHSGKLSTFLHSAKKPNTPEIGTNVTDEMLQALLARVNAREVTTYLNLDSCDKLVGHGLEPLSGSRVLERISLNIGIRTMHRTMDEPLILGILRTMLPHKLFDVKLPFWGFLPHNGHGVVSWRLSFDRDLRAAMKQRELARKTQCASCQNLVRDESRQIIPSFHGMPASRCCKCHEQYCRTATCPIDMKDCRQCGKTSCTLCKEVLHCGACSMSYCSGCKEVSGPCNVCGKHYCERCSEVFSCADCKITMCSACERVSELSLQKCVECDTEFCSSCRPMSMCIRCDEPACSECCGVIECFRCANRGVLCTWCIIKYDCVHCDSCDKSQCRSCENDGGVMGFILACGRCDGVFCTDCRKECWKCERFICSACFGIAGDVCQHCISADEPQAKRQKRDSQSL